jgi:hypothetical protein
MQTQDLKEEITALEIRLKHLNELLDKSIKDNEILAKTKVIYHDLRLVSDRLKHIKEAVLADGQTDRPE